jgi:hypothetical protein
MKDQPKDLKKKINLCGNKLDRFIFWFGFIALKLACPKLLILFLTLALGAPLSRKGF